MNRIHDLDESAESGRLWLSVPEFLDYREQNRVFADMTGGWQNQKPSKITMLFLGMLELEARVRIELTHKGFADLSLTTWVPRPKKRDE